jgi:uridylate kinase
MDNALPMVVFGMVDGDAIVRVTKGEKIGTYVGAA